MNSILAKVRFFTSTGEYVTSGHIPPFNAWPKGMAWGTRFFYFEKEIEEDERKIGIFREGFTTALVEHKPEDNIPKLE